MKRILTLSLFALLAISAKAQTSVGVFTLADELFHKQLPMLDLAEKYKNNITDETFNGNMVIRNVNFCGYESSAKILYNPDGTLRTLFVEPDIDTFSATEKYVYANECHCLLSNTYGEPTDIEEIPTGTAGITGGTKYTWNINGLVITGIHTTTLSHSLYMLMITNINSQSSDIERAASEKDPALL